MEKKSILIRKERGKKSEPLFPVNVGPGSYIRAMVWLKLTSVGWIVAESIPVYGLYEGMIVVDFY